MQRRMAETFQSLERDEQGYATANALLAIVSAMKAIPGRKSVVFFSEGLAIPPNVQSQFDSVIDAANRANVSIYPMDAAGLRTESTTKETAGRRQRSQRRDAGTQSHGRRDRPADDDGAREERRPAARRSAQRPRQLADQTGGFLIANTNDLRGGFSASIPTCGTTTC